MIVTQPWSATARRCARAARGAGIALCVFLAICAGPLWLQFWGPLHQHGSPFTLSFYEADLHGFYLPSHMFWLSTRGSAAFAARYGGGPAEYLAYLGVPLLVVAPLVGVARITDRNARMLLGTGLIFAVFSLGGPTAGRRQAHRHPPALGSGGALARVRIRAAGPVRARGRAGRRWPAGHRARLADGDRPDRRAGARPCAGRGVRGAAAAQALRHHGRAGCPAFLHRYPALAPGRSTVLVLPYPTGTQTLPLAWQTAADMSFQMPGGYFIGPGPGGEAYVGGPGPLPVAVTLIHIEQGTAAPPVTPAVRAEFRQELAYWGAGAIVAGPGARPALSAFVQALMQRPPIRAGGVLLWGAGDG